MGGHESRGLDGDVEEPAELWAGAPKRPPGTRVRASSARRAARLRTGREAQRQGDTGGIRRPSRSRREKPRGGQTTYFIGEKAAGIRILFCWLTKNSRVFGGQLGSFCDSSRIRARSARSL